VADLPYRDVAEAMGTSEEAARRNVHEGLRALRRSGGEALRAGG
jgi:DNA-directed RNA polymerase specialized sigma24 family protein